MSDPHDRPYTFGWHGETVLRPVQTPASDAQERAVATGDTFAETLRAAREGAWNECLQAVAWAIENGPWEHALPYVEKNNPHRKDSTA